MRPRPRRPPPVTVLGSGNVYGLYSGHFRLMFGLVSDFLSWHVCFGNLPCGHVGFRRTG